MPQPKLKSLLVSSLLIAGLSACDGIPGAYQGTFVDQPTGTKFVIDSSSVTMTDAGGRSLSVTPAEFDFDKVSQGQSGIYTRPSQSNENVTEIFWLIPDLSSRQENSGFVWYTTEIFYTRMNGAQNDDVSDVELSHCTDGVLMLDMPSQTWDAGCGTDAQQLDALRVGN